MKVFLVRNKESKGILGIFWASNQLQLADTIDEVGDPDNYECTIIRKFGGICFEGEDIPVVQWTSESDGSEPDFSWADADITENMLSYMYHQKEHHWISVL